MKKNRKYRVALIGTDSLRGREIRNVLSGKKFPLRTLDFFDPDVEQDYSKLTDFQGEPKVIHHPSEELLKGIDLLFLAADAATNRKYGRLAAESDYLAIDLQETFNDDEDVPLVVAGINDPGTAARKASLIANPNPVTTLLAHLYHALGLEGEIRKAVAFVLQPASAFEEAGIHELVEQSAAVLSGSPVSRKVFRDQVAFNFLSRTEKLLKDGFSAGEKRILTEIRRVLGGSAFPMTLSIVQAPVFHTCSIMVYVEMDERMNIAGLETLFRQNAFFALSHQESSRQASATTVAGKDKIFIGQIKMEESIPGSFWIWIVADNLTMGSALNAYEIAYSSFLGPRANA